MAWTAVFDGTVVNFDDLSPSVFAEIADEGLADSWWQAYTFPGGNPERLHRVLVKCAEKAGVEPPAHPETMREAKALLNFLEMGEDLDDAVYVDGNPPTPEAQETDSSIGLSGDSDGLQAKPDENP